MVLAATRIDSRRRSMSRSADSDAPMSFSCSRRCMRSSSDELPPSASLGISEVSRMLLMPMLFHADRAHFLHMRHAHQALLHAVLLQGAHAVLEALREHVGDARVLLDQLLQLVGGDQQLVQAAASLEAAAAALVAADRLVEGELALVVAVQLHPL